jgi:FkbM family methyltransferase
MAKLFRILIRKTLLGKEKNLVSIDEPYGVMARLLRGRQVTGIIDAGASNGRISRRLLRIFPGASAYAFEPNPFYADLLQQYADEDPRFRPQFLALSDREGISELHVTASPGNTSLLIPGECLEEMDPEGSSVKNVEKVTIVTIDGWLKANSNPQIQLMKFDIQGAELRALQGARRVLRASTLLVYTEILFNNLYKGGAVYSEIDQYLRKYGFVLYDIYKPKYNVKGLLVWGNAIFIHSERLGI